MPGKRSRASRNIRPSRTSAVAASTCSGDGAAASAAGVPWRTIPRSAEAAAELCERVGHEQVRALARDGRAPARCGSALWRSFASALAP